jgi:hypothetical protein
MGQSGAFRLHPARASRVDKSQEFQGIYAGDFQEVSASKSHSSFFDTARKSRHEM